MRTCEIAAPSQASNQNEPPEDRAEVRGLRQTAFRATTALSAVSVSKHTSVIYRLLQDIAVSVGASDTHLFQVKIQKDGSKSVGLRISSGRIDDPQMQPLRKFQFQLFSSQVQNCLLSDEIASIQGESPGAGRLINGLMKQTQCSSYILCPVMHNEQLQGMLGIAYPKQVTKQPRAYFELLKLNGAILLSHLARFQKERRRRRKLKQWREIANHACDFAVSVDSRSHILNTLPFGMSTIGRSLNGLRLIDIVTRNFHRVLDSQIARAVQLRQPRTCDIQLSFGHEGPRWYLARIEPGSEREGCYATLFLTDNNPDKVLEEQVRELNDSLVKASRLSLLGQMSTEFAHQLNQPLQAILNYCNIIQRRLYKGSATEDNILDCLSNVETSVKHSGDIIQRIRDFVKFRSLLTTDVPLKDLIDQAVMMVIPTARGWNADLIPPIDTPALVVDVDKAQTTHVFVNLMINALEACCDSGLERPRVEIYVREDTGRQSVLVCIKDNGPGLPDDPSIVFRKFYSSKSEGLGMGLAISREVCETQGGNLTAQNNSDGPGCTFVVRLPLTTSTGSDTAELEVIEDPNYED